MKEYCYNLLNLFIAEVLLKGAHFKAIHPLCTQRLPQVEKEFLKNRYS